MRTTANDTPLILVLLGPAEGPGEARDNVRCWRVKDEDSVVEHGWTSVPSRSVAAAS